jgi:amino acid transporter
VENGSSSELEGKLGLFPLTNIVIANMIGAGIFTTSGLLMSDLGNPLLMLALWVVGGIIALCGALAYGELGAAMPQPAANMRFFPNYTTRSLDFSAGGLLSSSGSPRRLPPRPSASANTSSGPVRIFLLGDPAIVKRLSPSV